MDLTSVPVPSSPEMPFFKFTSELIGVYRPIKAELADAMEARYDWRDAAARAMPESLSEIDDPAPLLQSLDEQTARLMKARPSANLRAAGILVTRQAIMEDLRQGVVGNVREQFGPLIND